MKYETKLEAYVREQANKYLEAQGITPYQLGMSGDVSLKTVYNFINGVTKPSLEMLELVCITLGVPLGEFFKDYDKANFANDKVVPKNAPKPSFLVKLQQNDYKCLETPAYIIKSPDNKEIYVMAKLENSGRFDDGAEIKHSLILKDELFIGS